MNQRQTVLKFTVEENLYTSGVLMTVATVL